MAHYIVLSYCKRLLRQVLLSLREFADPRQIVAIAGPQARDMRWSGLAGRHLPATFAPQDDDRLVTMVNTLGALLQDPVLIPADCDAAMALNRVGGHLAVRSIPLAPNPLLARLNDKWGFHGICREAGLRVPRTVHVGRKDNLDYDALAAQLGLPFVLKPTNQAGSNGVLVVHGHEQWMRQVVPDNVYRFDSLIAQQYVPGVDLCFSFLARDGDVAAFSIQQRVGPTIRFLENAELEMLGLRLAEATRYSGVMNIDARVEEGSGRVFLIESNPRFWASLAASVWCGLNFVAESIAPVERRAVPRRLTAGVYYERHPVMRPSVWLRYAFDSGREGRMWRAAMGDVTSLKDVIRQLPEMGRNYSSRKLAAITGLLGRKPAQPAVPAIHASGVSVSGLSAVAGNDAQAADLPAMAAGSEIDGGDDRRVV